MDTDEQSRSDSYTKVSEVKLHVVPPPPQALLVQVTLYDSHDLRPSSVWHCPAEIEVNTGNR